MRAPRLFAATAVAAVAASAFISFPAAVAATVPDPALHYTFDTLDGTLGAGTAVPDSGSRSDRADGRIVNGGATLVTGVTGDPSDKALRLSGGRNDADALAPYLALPNDIVSAGDTAVTVSMWTKWDGPANGNCQLAFGLGRSTTKNLLASTSCNGTYGGVSDAPRGEQRVGNGGDALPVGVWTNIALVFQPGEKISYYVNGQLDGPNGEITGIGHTIDAALGQGDVGGYIGRSFWDDPFFGGAVDDVRIWNSALSADEVRAAGAAQYEALLAADSVSLGDTSAVSADLSLPRRSAAGSAISWSSSDVGIISTGGEVTRPSASEGDAAVTLTPTFQLGGQSRTGAPIPVTVRAVPGSEPEEAVREVADSLTASPSLTGDVRGSLTLPDSGAELGVDFSSSLAEDAEISWTSSDPDVITDTDQGQAPNVVRKGSVTRGSVDRTITLTATVRLGAVERVVEIPAKVLAASTHTEADNEAYMFVYFRDNSVEGEKIRFAVSEGNDALNWRTLNGGNPVLESTKGDQGLRDPFVLRSKEGDRFFLIATDLSAARKGFPTDHGSRYLEIWESTDLVNWGEQRHIEVSPPSAGMTWAPEAHYDPTIDAYVVYWSSRLFLDDAHTQEDGNGPQILMATTRDFMTFTPAEPYIKSGDIPGLRKTNAGLIDTTILERDGVYYRFTKGTEETACRPDIVAEKGADLRAPSSTGAWTKFDTCLSANAGLPETEGPSAFRSNPGDINGDRNYVLVDWYGGGGYIPLYTESLVEGEVDWKVPSSYSLPPSPRHGVAFGITRAERDALIARWNPDQLVTSVAPVEVSVAPGTTRVTLPGTVEAARPGGAISVGVTWPDVDLSGLHVPGDSVQVRGALNDGSALPAVATITAVGTPVGSTSVEIGYRSGTLAVGSTATFTAAVQPSNAEQRVSWSSSDSDIVAVDSAGRVTARKKGTAVVTATSADGRKDVVAVTVVAAEADLLLRYSFDGGADPVEGARIVDVSGRGNDATLRGTGATSVVGASQDAGDVALSLPGGPANSAAAYAAIPTGVIPEGIRDLTLSTWLRWDGGPACQWPLSLGANTSNYLFTSPDCGGLAAGIKAGYREDKSGAAALPVGVWSQVTLVLSGGQKLATYVDGRKVTEVATRYDAADLESAVDHGGFLAKSPWAPDSYFAGDLDEVRMYGRALSADEVHTLFTEGTLVDTSPEPEPTPTTEPSPSPEPSGSPSPLPTGSGAPTPQPTSSPTGPQASASVDAVERGGIVRVTVTGLEPGEQVTAELRSDPIRIAGIPAADASGRVSFDVRVPLDLSEGAHTIVVYRADGSVIARLPVTVAAKGTLAATGVQVPLGIALVATLSLIAGAGAVVLRRPRTRRTL